MKHVRSKFMCKSTDIITCLGFFVLCMFESAYKFETFE